MHIVFKINIVFICVILLTGLFSLLNFDTVFFLLIALFFTGIFQGISGIILFLASPQAIHRQLYVGGLGLFGLLCYTEWLWMLPPIPLACYFSYQLYIETHSKTI